MELYDVMRTTFACREFTGEPVPEVVGVAVDEESLGCEAAGSSPDAEATLAKLESHKAFLAQHEAERGRRDEDGKLVSIVVRRRGQGRKGGRGKPKGKKPKKVRPYRLDYRPLIDADLTEKAIDFIAKSTLSTFLINAKSATSDLDAVRFVPAPNVSVGKFLEIVTLVRSDPMDPRFGTLYLELPKK